MSLKGLLTKYHNLRISYQLRPYWLKIRHPSLKMSQVFKLLFKFTTLTNKLPLNDSKIEEKHNISWSHTMRYQVCSQLQSLINDFHHFLNVLPPFYQLFLTYLTQGLLIDYHQSSKVLQFFFCQFEPLVNFGLLKVAERIDLVLP